MYFVGREWSAIGDLAGATAVTLLAAKSTQRSPEWVAYDRDC